MQKKQKHTAIILADVAIVIRVIILVGMVIFVFHFQ